MKILQSISTFLAACLFLNPNFFFALYHIQNNFLYFTKMLHMYTFHEFSVCHSLSQLPCLHFAIFYNIFLNLFVFVYNRIISVSYCKFSFFFVRFLSVYLFYHRQYIFFFLSVNCSFSISISK